MLDKVGNNGLIKTSVAEQQNKFHAKHLQPEIMPFLVEKGVIKPNKQKIVEGKTLLERAQNALDALRRKEVSGERLVWRVSEE